MKISRPKLIELVDAEIARRERAADARHIREVTEYREQRERYRVATQAAWCKLANRIIERVSAQETVTLDDVPRELIERERFRANAIPLWHAVDEPTRPNPQTNELRQLRALLEASSDEEISTYALEKQGFPLGRTLTAGR